MPLASGMPVEKEPTAPNMWPAVSARIGEEKLKVSAKTADNTDIGEESKVVDLT